MRIATPQEERNSGQLDAMLERSCWEPIPQDSDLEIGYGGNFQKKTGSLKRKC